MNAQEMWQAYISRENISADYTAWAFGAAPDELAQLVLSGIKTATSSAYPLYERFDESLPKAGDFSVILNARDDAVCIIQTTRVFVCAFSDVDDLHAFREGEGDRSLGYWRKVHEAFFRSAIMDAGLSFDMSMKVVCEEFKKVYP